jgi:DNA-binding transcriptional MocR family regulator
LVNWRDTGKIDRLQEFMSIPMVTRNAAAASRLALSDISADILQSEIRAMSVECDRIHGINLAQGVCDIDPPAPVVEAAIAAIQNGHNIYTRLDGISPLRAEISKKLLDYNGISSEPDSGILVTSGATGAFLAGCMALLTPGMRFCCSNLFMAITQTVFCPSDSFLSQCCWTLRIGRWIWIACNGRSPRRLARL